MTALYKILNYCDIATRLDSTSPKRLDFRAYPAFRVTHLVQNVTAYAQRTAPPRTPAQKISEFQYMVAKCLDPAWHRAHPDPYSCREVVTFRMTAPGLKRSIVFSRPTPPELYRG